MDIHASPLHLAQASAANPQRQQELQQQREQIAQEQKQKTQQQAEALTISRSENRQRDQQRVYQVNRSANLAQQLRSPLSSAQSATNTPSTSGSNLHSLEDDAVELKPLVVSERTHPAVKSFLRVAELENDFHIIDTYV